ncbi:MAG: EAL domain-containing protein [Maricaulaceae bacterium]
MRWRHKELGPVSPAEFVGLAEATALITPLTRWVVKAALRQFAQWSEPARPQKLSINISPKNTTEPDFIAFMAQACDEAGVAPHRIELEFTEGVLAADIAQTVERLSALKALGFEIAIDDFGSGYSNMRYLMDLPAQILKIDQTFIRALPDQPKSATLVRGMIELGHALGFRVVAEGVETAQILDQLRGWGCDEVQGYHLARPMPSDAFADWLRQNPTA